jgi:hypothetical protein
MNLNIKCGLLLIVFLVGCRGVPDGIVYRNGDIEFTMSGTYGKTQSEIGRTDNDIGLGALMGQGKVGRARNIGEEASHITPPKIMLADGTTFEGTFSTAETKRERWNGIVDFTKTIAGALMWKWSVEGVTDVVDSNNIADVEKKSLSVEETIAKETARLMAP